MRGLFGKDRHGFDVCRLKVRKQLMQVWNVEPATGKVGTLTRKTKGLNTEHARVGGRTATRGKLTISRSKVGWRIESNESKGSGESRGE
jgi:hypothetical protein